MKGKEEVSETMLNEKEAGQLSDIEFKELIIRKLNELTKNYQKLQGNYHDSLQTISTWKRKWKLSTRGQEEMKNTIFELKKTIEGIKSMLEEVEDRSSEMEEKV